MTFLYSFLHNHKDMVNLKNIFFFKNHFSNFIIEKNGNFEGCLIGAKTLENKWTSKNVYVYKYSRCLEHLCKFSTKSIKDNHWALLGKNFGSKYASFYSVKMSTWATCRCRYSVGFSPLVHTCPVEAKEQIIGNFRHEFE